MDLSFTQYILWRNTGCGQHSELWVDEVITNSQLTQRTMNVTTKHTQRGRALDLALAYCGGAKRTGQWLLGDGLYRRHAAMRRAKHHLLAAVHRVLETFNWWEWTDRLSIVLDWCRAVGMAIELSPAIFCFWRLCLSLAADLRMRNYRRRLNNELSTNNHIILAWSTWAHKLDALSNPQWM